MCKVEMVPQGKHFLSFISHGMEVDPSHLASPPPALSFNPPKRSDNGEKKGAKRIFCIIIVVVVVVVAASCSLHPLSWRRQLPLSGGNFPSFNETLPVTLEPSSAPFDHPSNELSYYIDSSPPVATDPSCDAVCTVYSVVL